MAYEIKDNSGSLFKNDKDGVEARPDYTGNCRINGEFLRIAAWLQKDRNGNTYMSLKFTEPDAERQRAQAVGGENDIQAPPKKDDLPF